MSHAWTARVRSRAFARSGTQFTPECDNEIEADLADAIAVVLAIVTAVADGMDAVTSASTEEGD
jgi:hypothetical protein